jgi:hypothetical protein
MGSKKPSGNGTNKIRIALSRSEKGCKIRIFCKRDLRMEAESAFPERRRLVMK